MTEKRKCCKIQTDLKCRATAELCDEILDELNVPDPEDTRTIAAMIDKTLPETHAEIENEE